MVKKIKSEITDYITAINVSTLTAKEKELTIQAFLSQKVQRNEDIVEDA